MRKIQELSFKHESQAPNLSYEDIAPYMHPDVRDEIWYKDQVPNFYFSNNINSIERNGKILIINRESTFI